MSTSFRTEENGLSGAIAFSGTDNITLKAAGPELLGIPKAPTATVGANTTQIANTAFVTAAITASVSNVISPSNATPVKGTVSGTPGVSTTYSRGDHAHPVGAQSLVTNGYTTLAGGLLLQWGQNVFTPAGSQINFPISFSSPPFSLTFGVGDDSNPPTAAVATGVPTATGFRGHCAQTFNVYWMALGKA